MNFHKSNKTEKTQLKQRISQLEEELSLYKKKLMHHQILTSTKNINNALDVSNAPIFSVDNHGNINIWNQGIARITGYSFDDVGGLNIENFIEKKKKYHTKHIIKRILKGEKLSFEEIAIKTSIDTEVHILSNPTPIKDDDGTIIGCIFIGQDITERKLIAAALRESENFYRRITENSSDFILIFSSTQHIDYISPSVTNILGYTIEEFIELNLSDLILPDDYKSFNAAMRKFISNQIFEHIVDLHIRHKDGTWRVIECVAQNYLDDPILNGIVLRSRNVTERREMEEILEFERNQLFTLFDSIPSAIYIADPIDYDVLYANLTVRKTLGYNPVGEKCHKVFFDLELPCPDCTNKDLFEKDGKPMNYIFQNPKFNRTYMILDQFIKWLDGRTVRFEVATDITELKQTQKELETKNMLLQQKNEELENFAYFASHDLPEPLRMVSTYLSLFERKYKENLDEKADLYIHYAVDGANRMNEMIKALLKYSRVDKEQNFCEFDVNQKISEALNNIKMLIEDSGAKITIGEMPQIYGEPILFTQVIQNLVSNAIKFSDENPEIVISVKNLEHEWEFSVKDNGIGIDKRYFEQIFNFKRLHPRDEYPGSGIGLPLCKKIITNHNGRIWLESKLSKGTTFYFIIPKNLRRIN
ncbi:MAG: PAS domain S-box protein [Candidatus Lokiarchaeota archaeon]|nr:PAS domain S-box protein [Candidatus Lokiarchaeota archaeon]